MQFKQATDFAMAGAFSEKVAGPSKPSPGQGLLLCRWIDDHGGKAANCRVYHGHWKTTTFVGGLTKSGIVAPMLLGGPINGDSFKTYVEQVLAPVIRSGDLVVLDNLSSHKTAMVRKSLEDNGIRTLYLPPYSPDFNPIENAFSKRKASVKSAGQRSIAGLWGAVGQLIDRVLPADAQIF